MLPKAQKITRSEDFSKVFRSGKRAGRSTVVCHFWHPCLANAAQDIATGPAKAGLVVGKVVGNSVTRHRVSRVLRHSLRVHLATMPPGSMVVIRALSPAGTAAHAEIVADVAATLAAVVKKLPAEFPSQGA